MASNLDEDLDFWYTFAQRAWDLRDYLRETRRKVEAKMILTEKYETKNGTVVFSTPGSDLEFVLVERHRMLWYLGVVERVDDMGINPQSVKPVEPDKL